MRDWKKGIVQTWTVPQIQGLSQSTKLSPARALARASKAGQWLAYAGWRIVIMGCEHDCPLEAAPRLGLMNPAGHCVRNMVQFR